MESKLSDERLREIAALRDAPTFCEAQDMARELLVHKAYAVAAEKRADKDERTIVVVAEARDAHKARADAAEQEPDGPGLEAFRAALAHAGLSEYLSPAEAVAKLASARDEWMNSTLAAESQLADVRAALASRGYLSVPDTPLAAVVRTALAEQPGDTAERVARLEALLAEAREHAAKGSRLLRWAEAVRAELEEKP